MNAKLIGAILVLVIAVSLFGGGFYLGGQHAKTKQQAAVIKAQSQQNKAVEQVQQAQVKREIVYRDRLKVIHDVKDNCADTPMPDEFVRLLSVRPGS